MRNEIGYLLAALWFVFFVIASIMHDELKVYCTTFDGTKFHWDEEKCHE